MSRKMSSEKGECWGLVNMNMLHILNQYSFDLCKFNTM